MPENLQTLFRPFDDSPTMTDHAPPGSSGPRAIDVEPAWQTQGPRYAVKSVLGRGGMGEVRLCIDARVGREVAVKLAHDKGGSARARFLREARVQGQLEHPAIVPVHDLDVLDDGSAYFVMRRIRGQTLAELLARKETPLRKLLGVLQSVCLAIELAHSRGVVHRDIKPQNIMVGDFGEVYVLDWGLAKVLGEPDSADARDTPAVRDTPAISSEDGVHTQVGTLLGTPGYMAPEQVSGGAVGARTDVYALGAVLFEIVAGRPVLPGRDPLELTVRTLRGVDRHPARVNADVPEALDAICARALALDPAERYASARALHDAIDAHLAGEADVERRRALSAQHATRASALARGPLEDAVRAEALTELGRALALDPENAGARKSLLRLLTEPPARVPPEVTARLRADDDVKLKAGMRESAVVLSVFLAFPVLAGLTIGVRDWAALVFVLFAMTIPAVVSGFASTWRRMPRWVQYGNVVFVLAAYVALARAFGPYILLPQLLTGLAVTMQTHPDPRFGVTCLVASCVAMIAAVLLETAGVLEPSYAIVDGGLLLKEHGLVLNEAALAFLFAATLGSIVMPALYAYRNRRALSDAEQRLQVQAWQLEQLVRDA